MTKVCSNCNDPKPTTEFHKRSDRKSGLYSWCKTCVQPRSAAYRAKKANKISVEKAEWRKNNKDKIKKNDEQFRLNHPDKRNANGAKYRAKKLHATPKWLSKDQLKEIESYYSLAKELQWLSEETLHVDHIIPLQGENVSGLHVPWNLQILPEKLNIVKGNRVTI